MLTWLRFAKLRYELLAWTNEAKFEKFYDSVVFIKNKKDGRNISYQMSRIVMMF